MKRILSIIVALIVSFGAVAQNPVGVWEGKLSVDPNMSMRLVIEITQDGEDYNSKLISVDQGNAEIQGTNTTFDNGSLTATFSMIGAKYTASVSSAELNGTFSQSGQQFPLVMTKSTSGEATKIDRPQTPKAPYSYNIEDVTFTNRIEGNALSGTLTKPKDNGRIPAVVLVSGSGAQNRDSELFNHKPFWVIADYLSRNGVAVLRFDDRGVGKSSKGEVGATTDDLAHDAEAGVEYLRSRGEFSSVGVIGHSEGGLIAFLLAGDSRYITPDFIISMAGCGIVGADVLAYQTNYALSQIDIPQSERENAANTNRAIYDAILNSEELNAEVVAKVRKIAESSMPTTIDPQTAEKEIARVVQTATAPWMYNFIKFNPAPIIEKIKCPVLALNGSLDRQVEASSNLLAIETALKRAGNKQYKIAELKGLNHLFQKAESGDVAEYGEIEETVNVTALEMLSEWINKYCCLVNQK
ncbi:MAG: alpha/beta fold hydrolase [Rikenellaceae bacterium]